MNQFLYKGFIALDDIRNKPFMKKKNQDDYLMIRQEDDPDDDQPKKKKITKNYRFMIPRVPDTSAVKIFNEKKMLKAFLMADESEFFKKDNFQRQYFFEAPRILWKSEKYQDIGDYVLLFPNPDFKSVDNLKDNGITFNKAVEAMHVLFETSYSFPYKQQFMNALKEAFEEALLTVEEFATEEELNKRKEKEGVKVIERKEPKDNHVTQADENDVSRKEPEKLNPAEVKQPKSRSKASSLAKKKNQVEKISIEGEKEIMENPEEEALNSDRGESARERNVKDIHIGMPGQEDPEGLVKKAADPQFEAFKVSLAEKNAEQERLDEIEDLIDEKKKRRKVWGGGLLIPPGKEADGSDCEGPQATNKHEWKRNSGKMTNDFMTLLRKSVCAVLANHGFITRELYVDKGQNIAVVMTLPEINLKKIAQEMKLLRPVEFGMADLSSLEPVDSKKRPLRTNAYLYDPEIWKKTYCSDKKKDEVEKRQLLREEILGLIETDASLKRATRMCNGVWNEPKTDFVTGIYDHEKISISTWEKYRDYLYEVALRIKEIEIILKKVRYVYQYDNNPREVATRNNIKIGRLFKVEMYKFASRELVAALKTSIKNHSSLKNIWDYIGVAPVEYMFQYQASNNHMRPVNRIFYESAWKDYITRFKEVDGVPTVYYQTFNKLEKLKIMDYLLKKINNQMEALRRGGSLFGGGPNEILFPLHDREKMTSKDYTEKFDPLRDIKEIYDEVQIQKQTAAFQYTEMDPKEKKSKDDSKSQVGSKAGGSVASARRSQVSKSKKEDPLNVTVGSVLPEESKKKKILKTLNLIRKFGSFSNPSLEQGRRDFFNLVLKTNIGTPGSYHISDSIKIFEEICGYYEIDDALMYSLVSKAKSTSSPVRNILPAIFVRRPFSTFQTPIEITVDPPVSKLVTKTYRNNLASYPEAAIRYYFGEKIALYFAFQAHFRDQLILPSLISIFLVLMLIFYRVSDIDNVKDSLKAKRNEWVKRVFQSVTTGFCIYLVFWGKYFLAKWRRFEQKFANRYGRPAGTDDTGSSRQPDEQVRTAFRGRYHRNITNDRLNDAQENPIMVYLMMFVTFVFLVAASVATFYSSYGILVIKRNAVAKEWIGVTLFKTLNLDQNLWDIVEYFRILGFSFLFFWMVNKMIRLQNLKFEEAHQRQLIFYLGIYSLLNNSSMIMLVAMQTVNLSLTNEREEKAYDKFDTGFCINNECTRELYYFFATYSIFGLIFTVIWNKIVIPATRKVIKLARGKMEKREDVDPELLDISNLKPKRENEPSNLDEGQGLAENDYRPLKADAQRKILVDAANIFYTKPMGMYAKIDDEIDFQVSSLSDYKTSEDYENILIDYLEIFVNYSMVSMFGALFPLSFVVYFISGILKWTIDNEWVMELTRRPKPVHSISIGIWSDMLEAVSLLAIGTNSFYFTLIVFEDATLFNRFLGFTISISGLFLLTHFYYIANSDPSEKAKIVVERSRFVQHTMFAGAQQSLAAAMRLKLQMLSKMHGKGELAKRDNNLFDMILEQNVQDILEENEENQPNQSNILDGVTPRGQSQVLIPEQDHLPRAESNHQNAQAEPAQDNQE